MPYGVSKKFYDSLDDSNKKTLRLLDRIRRERKSRLRRRKVKRKGKKGSGVCRS